MRFPDWLKVKRQRRVGNTVEVTLEVRSDELARRFAELGKAMGPVTMALASFGQAAIRAAADMERAMDGFRLETTDSMVAFVRREVRRAEVAQAGLEARYYVRGGMDPTYATPEARDAYAQAVLTYATNGPALVAAFLRGWVEHHPEPVQVDSGWSPVATTVACDWCGDCAWCRSLHSGSGVR